MKRKRDILIYLEDISESSGLIASYIHKYFGVTLTMIWKLAVEDIPVLKKQIDEILEQL